MSPPEPSRTVRPPRLARWLLGLAFPPDTGEQVLADLDEEFREHRVPAMGAGAARRWYRAQALRSLSDGLAMRAGALARILLAGTGRDLHFATRTLRRSPGLAAVVIGSLGIGIGGFVLVWGVVDGVVLHPFPYPEPERLVAVVVRDRTGGTDFIENVSPPEFVDVRRQARTLERLYAFDDGWSELETPSGVISVWSTVGWGEPFTTLGVRPWLGRGFLPHELEPYGADLMILSHRVWVREFGADSSVVGRSFDLGRNPRTVVGVMPPGVLFHDADVWTPPGSPPARRARGPRRLFQIVGRVRAGYELSDVNRELAQLSRAMAAAHGPEHPEYEDRTLHAVTWTRAKVADYRPVALLLMAAAGLLLLLITLNVSAVLLARSVRRARELAVRVALGAGRARLLRQLSTEGVLLALLGGAIGVGVAFLGLHQARSMLAGLAWVQGQPYLGWQLLPFTLGVSAGVGILVSLVPAIAASSADVQIHLRTEGPGATESSGMARRQGLLVTAEVGLTVIVLAAGAVVGRALLEVARVDPGFDTSRLLTLRLALPGSYGPEEARDFFIDLERRAASLGGVRSAGVTTSVHPASWPRSISLNGSDRTEVASVRYATPAYLESIGVELVHGSPDAFTADPTSPPAALVNRAFARLHGGEDAVLGMTVRDMAEELGRAYHVVGVVEDLPNAGLLRPPGPEVVFDHHHIRTDNSAMYLVVRAVADPLEAVPALRDLVGRLDPRLPLNEVATVESELARDSAPLRIATWCLVLLSLCALVLAALGVSGLVAFGAARRRREFGLRRALGAREVAVRKEMMARTLRPAAAGVALGSTIALIVGDRVAPLLPPPAEPAPLLVLATLPAIALVAALAAYVPALRASRADPCEVMRAP